MKENGAAMPDCLVRTLLTIIHAILPPNSKKDSGFDGKMAKYSKDRANPEKQEIGRRSGRYRDRDIGRYKHRDKR